MGESERERSVRDVPDPGDNVDGVGVGVGERAMERERSSVTAGERSSSGLGATRTRGERVSERVMSGSMVAVSLPVGCNEPRSAGASGSPCVSLCPGRLGRAVLVVIIAGPLLHAKQWVRSGRFSVKIGEIGVVRSLITNQNVR